MKIRDTLTEKVIPGFTSCGIIFSCTLAACVCLGLNIRFSLFGSVICSFLSIPLNKQILAPDGFLLVPAVLVLAVTGTTGLALSILLGYLLFILLKSIFKDFSLPCFTAAGGALGLAFCVTALFTTLYFGIGATGKTTWEILKNYRYLGFHPNWRGVFYGTVTLFAMITYPFKFKKLSKYLPKEVFSVGIPFLLNLWLNPDGNTTPILEVGALADFKDELTSKSLFPLSDISEVLSSSNIYYIITGAVCFSLLLFAYGNNNKRETVTKGVAGTLCSLVSGLPVRSFEIINYSVLSAVISAATCILIIIFCPALISRIPVHSLAVVFIVGSWQNVPFKKVAQTFKSKSILQIASVFIIFLSFFFLQPVYGFLVCVLLSLFIKEERK